MSLAQYENVCKAKFQEILDKQDAQYSKINGKLDNMHDRMFIDNGKPSIQTRLDRNERMWKFTTIIVTMICAAFIAQIARSVYDHMNKDRTEIIYRQDPNSQTALMIK